MQKAAGILRGRKAEYARTMTLEMGKPIVQGEAEAEKCAWTCEYYARARRRHARRAAARDRRLPQLTSASTRSAPVLARDAVELPFWQVFRFAAPR